MHTQINTHGIILKAIPYKDFHRIITLFTPDQGLVSMVVRGALALAILVPSVYLPVTLARHIQRDNDPVRNLMISDIQNLNDGSLSGHVQCLDWNSGCIGALYNLRLLPSTGFIYDFYLFPSKPAPITAELQSRFLAQVESAPPRMIILTSHDWPTLAQGFEKLDRWPAFHSWLDANYRLATERHHPDIINGKPFDRAYRIYVLR